jgi:hypothetical protein
MTYPRRQRTLFGVFTKLPHVTVLAKQTTKAMQTIVADGIPQEEKKTVFQQRQTPLRAVNEVVHAA